MLREIKYFDFDEESIKVWNIVNEILARDYSRWIIATDDLIEEATKLINNIGTIKKLIEIFKHRLEKHVKILNAKIPADDSLSQYAESCTGFYKGVHWVNNACDILNRCFIQTSEDKGTKN